MTDRTLPHENAVGDPAWLNEWRTRPLRQEIALARFDELADLALEDLRGEWRGTTLPTDHPLDGLLEALKWYGKRFERGDRVHPLLFRSVAGSVSLDPALLPLEVALRWPVFARSLGTRVAFSALLPVLKTREPTAACAGCLFAVF